RRSRGTASFAMRASGPCASTDGSTTRGERIRWRFPRIRRIPIPIGPALWSWRAFRSASTRLRIRKTPEVHAVPKFVFVTGGVTSSLGKGITAASLGRILAARSLAVASLKMDPYLNVDPGTMSPYQHGEVFVIEVGGTVGDIESLPYLEAIRQFRNDVGKQNVLYIHLTLLPRVATGELKTKPTQHSVRELRAIGIQPDVLIARADEPIDDELREKIALFCDVKVDNVISEPDAWSIYAVPLMLEEAGLGKIVVEELGLDRATLPDLAEWHAITERIRGARIPLTRAVVGQYIELPDAYLSVAL